MAKRTDDGRRVAAQNRKARHDYFIEEVVEAGLMLVGSEVKSLRAGRASIMDAHAGERGGEMWLLNAYIPEYQAANKHTGHDPHRPRKLLLHKRETDRLLGATKEKGMTLVPLDIHFNRRGIAKCDIAVARGKKQYDKRETKKERDWQRQKARLIREKG